LVTYMVPSWMAMRVGNQPAGRWAICFLVLRSMTPMALMPASAT